MKNWAFAFLFSLIASIAVAYPPSNTIESSLRALKNGNYHDLDRLKNLYSLCANPSEMIALERELESKISAPAHRSLNQIACALALDFRGEHAKAVKQLTALASHLSSQSNYVRGEYYCALGKISYTSENPTGAIQSYKKGIQDLEKTKESIAIQIAYTNLGLAFAAIDQHETALANYDKATSITTKSSPKIQLYLHLNKAISLTHLGKNTESKRAFKHALDIIYEMKDYFAEIRTYGNLADIYLREDSLELAEYYFLKGRKTAVAHQFKLDLIRFDHSLAQLYQQQGKYQEAFFFLKQYDSIRNSVQLDKTAEDIAQLETSNQLAIKKIEQASLRETIRIKQHKNILLWIGILLLGLFSLALLRQFLVIRRKNKVLLRKNLEEQVIPANDRVESNQTTLPNEELQAIIQSFEALLVHKKAYCKADLTQEKVAKKLGTNRTYLSKAINDHYKMSYSRWINELRIKESKKMLMDANFNHFSIEGIATSVGFSSLSAFNANFKSITGLTPSYFRNNISSI